MVESNSDFDFHQLLVPTPTNDGPPRAASDSSGPSSDAGSYFIPESLSRSDSVFSFSRASFSSQLAGLTSMSPPQAESLAASISTLPTAKKAVGALNSSAEQIQQWTKKALKVLENLDADDDVEWAAAAGREGLEDTDATINTFEHIISVYVLSIEDLQARPDVAHVKTEDFTAVVDQMEVTLDGWENVRKDLKRIHDQVELAMEWEELWGTVLADVGNELDGLSQLVFEMEEKRHNAYQTQTHNEFGQTVDLSELESFMDEPSKKRTTPNSRYSLPPAFESSPLGSPVVHHPTDDSNLLQLFARMQPLRASLDFLPMRLSMFQARAEKLFPTACAELEDKRDRLEKNWAQLTKEAEDLRKELSEDRWVVVFRNAGRQAQKMCESVARSVAKVHEALAEGYEVSNPIAMGKRIESFEAKKMHYGPAIERVLGIIQKGLKDRLTVNGEILRLHKDLLSKYRKLSDSMEDLGRQLAPVTPSHNPRFRESISSIVSTDRSISGTTFAGTPGSSPASSVDLPASRSDKPTPRYGLNGYTKPRAVSNSRPPLSSGNRKPSLLPQNRRPTTPSLPGSNQGQMRRGVSPSPGNTSVYRQGAYKPPVAPLPARPGPSPVINRPRWSSTVGPTEPVTTPKQQSSVSSTPATYRHYTPRSISSSTALTLRSPLSRENALSPSPALPTLLTGRHSSQQFRSFAERVASPSPAHSDGLVEPIPYHRGRNITAPVAGTIRSPSSLAVHNQKLTTRPSMTNLRQPSLNRTYGSRQTLPLREISDNSRLEWQSEDSAIGLDADHEANDHESDQIEPGSSPLSKRTLTRPPSMLAMAGRGRRGSMLPVPVGSSGRQSSLGSRLS